MANISGYLSRQWRCDCCGKGIPDDSLTEIIDLDTEETVAVVHRDCVDMMVARLEPQTYTS